MPTGTIVTLPQTIYAVALYYGFPGGKFVLASEPVCVSGVDPLTRDEVVARADGLVRARLEADGLPVRRDAVLEASSVGKVVHTAGRA